MEYEMHIEKNRLNEKEKTPKAYRIMGDVYCFEIEKIPKEYKEVGKAQPWIKLFCKSDNKCGA